MTVDIHPGALGNWVSEFVRLNNRAAGIVREPLPDEVAAHRGLFAANLLRVDNLEIFASYIQPGAVLRGAEGDAAETVKLRDDLRTLLQAAMQRLVPPRQLFRVYTLLRPFTAANGRCGRAFWMWQAMRGTAEDLDDFAELCPGEMRFGELASSTLM